MGVCVGRKTAEIDIHQNGLTFDHTIRAAHVIVATREWLFVYTSFLPIRTPMTDAIISPRVQPLESPRQ